ncbi:MerC domain-containing protein [Winogradskyella tangerina]|uniref:MerC domain-containing protein n=1 Tax=Winogradskyella tangerina TaxID=2023240 RepID=UPI000DBE65AF|nr:MerC domain-containing protein [Winogradskyella tangerina]
MILRSIKSKNSDLIGAFASGLCLLHCIATPFIFIAQTRAATYNNPPVWWGLIDVLFIGISFFAVYWSAINTSKTWMKYALWISWAMLCLIISNEKIGLVFIPEFSIYIPSITLIGLHLYNKRYCKCKDDNCCASGIK